MHVLGDRTARWNEGVRLIPAHLALFGPDGILERRVFADSEADALTQLVELLAADKAAADEVAAIAAQNLADQDAEVAKALADAAKALGAAQAVAPAPAAGSTPAPAEAVVSTNKNANAGGTE